MDELRLNRSIICIDLKSFFAACECLDRNLDMYTTPLVVADPSRKDGAITLAVTPYLKSLGIPSRGRIFQIPKNIKYITAKPRMSLYIKKSKEVIDVYLNYISSDDIHVYSIDEAFLDLTDYLKFYKMTIYELALKILSDIKRKTGLVGTCGIGPNLFLAKVAMDIEAKHNLDNIAYWTYNDVQTKLWAISPPSKLWGIGSRTEEKLLTMGIKTIGDLASYNKSSIKKKFGIIGEELWYRANGIDLTKISDLKINPREKSFSHSQVLFKDYYENNISIIIEEMCDVLTTRLRQEKKMTGIITLGIAYSKVIGGGFCHSQKLTSATDNTKEIYNQCLLIFSKYYNEDPIRKVSIALGHLIDKDYYQLNLFEENNEVIKNNSKDKAVDEIRNKYGKNSLIKVSNLLHDSTYIQRNKKIGGHNAE